MLNIFLKKCKKNINKISNKYMILKQNNIKKIRKEFLPVNKQWFSSVYAYNKNYLKNLPSYDKTVTKLIKSFFFLHPLYTRSFKLLKTNKKKKRRSVTRIWLSKAEIKHTNSKAIFTLYIYNAEKKSLVRKLRKINPLWQKKWRIKRKINKIKYQKKNLFELIKQITGKRKKADYKSKKNYWFWYKSKKRLKNKKMFLYLHRNKKNKNKFKSKYKYKLKDPRWLSRLLKKFLKKMLKKEKFSIYYKYLVWFNKSKFKNTYISRLSKLIKNFYEKKIEFNFINLKYLHFNTSIFSQFMVLKLKKRKIRLRRYLKRLFNKLYIPVTKRYQKKFSRLRSLRSLRSLRIRKKAEDFFITIEKNSQKYKYLYPFYLLKKTSLALLHRRYNKKNILKKDLLNQLIENRLLMEKKQKQMLKIEKKDKNYLEKIILKNIKYKKISGLKLYLAGRLSRRFIASRSIYIKKYKGNLKNKQSSFMIRGQLKSNIEYTKITSFVRIGSFGVKGWISTR